MFKKRSIDPAVLDEVLTRAGFSAEDRKTAAAANDAGEATTPQQPRGHGAVKQPTRRRPA